MDFNTFSADPGKDSTITQLDIDAGLSSCDFSLLFNTNTASEIAEQLSVCDA